MIVLEKYDGEKTYMFAWGGIADRDAVLTWNNAAVQYPHIVHTNEYGETLYYLYRLNDMRSNYEIPQGTPEAESIQMIQDKMNTPPPEQPDEKLTELEIIDSHPVGSIYMSVADTNPSELFPGTEWESWGEGRVPVGVAASGTFNTVEKTGGAETHTLTSAQMPKHLHRQRSQSNPPDNPATAQAWNYSDPVRDSRQKGNVNSVDSAETGGDGAHNNLQPYITCYMWKRIR